MRHEVFVVVFVCLPVKRVCASPGGNAIGPLIGPLMNSEIMQYRTGHADGNVRIFAVEHVDIKADRKGQHYGRHAEHGFQCRPNLLRNLDNRSETAGGHKIWREFPTPRKIASEA
jgi:hypothetical protein